MTPDFIVKDTHLPGLEIEVEIDVELAIATHIAP